MNKKNLMTWGAIVLLLFLVTNTFFPVNEISKKSSVKEMAFSEFIMAVKDKKVSDVLIDDAGNATGTLKASKEDRFTTVIGNYPDLYTMLEKNNVKFELKQSEDKGGVWSFIFNVVPTLLWVFVLILIIRSMRGGPAGGAKGFGIGQAKTKQLNESKKKITFKDVAGIDEARADVEEIVEFLKDPRKFDRLGGRIPKGVMLSGEPGTGKTLLARAIAGEADVPFFSISGSDFVEMFVGVGASRVRDLFEQGKKNAPCIIFIDEIDAVGRHRGRGYGGGNDEREQTLNQLLVEMDGFESNEGVILVAATNRPDVLDPALMRPGRFDRQIVVSLPDLKGREQILNIHLKRIKTADDVDAAVIARGTPGFSGAELENLTNEAALLAARHNHVKVTAEDFDLARDKILMGAERRTLGMSEKELKTTAYHEAGHAVAHLLLPGLDPIHKATIIPRGRALGMVQSLPERDKISETRTEILSNLVSFLAGRAAEETFFGHENVTTGAMNDIKVATLIVRRAVTMGGLSDTLGPIYYADDDMGYYAKRNISDETAKAVDDEVKAILDKAMKDAMALLKKHKSQTEAVANALLKYETLSGDEVKAVFDGKALDRQPANHDKKKVVKKVVSSVPKTK